MHRKCALICQYIGKGDSSKYVVSSITMVIISNSLNYLRFVSLVSYFIIALLRIQLNNLFVLLMFSVMHF